MNRGEVWLVRLQPTEGSEISKIRPAVIVSDDRIGILPFKVIVPITGWRPEHQQKSWMMRINPNEENGLSKPSAADAFQVRSVSQTRLINQIGNLSNIEMDAIANALIAVLSL